MPAAETLDKSSSGVTLQRMRPAFFAARAGTGPPLLKITCTLRRQDPPPAQAAGLGDLLPSGIQSPHSVDRRSRPLLALD